jgi:predicted kinase
VPFLIVHCVAPRAVLQARIAQRAVQGDDPSEATLDVLDLQLTNYSAPRADDASVLEIDTSAPLDPREIARAITDRVERGG